MTEDSSTCAKAMESELKKAAKSRPKRKCKRCGGSLVAIRRDRANGKNKHLKDWDSRQYHKKCFKEYRAEQYANRGRCLVCNKGLVMGVDCKECELCWNKRLEQEMIDSQYIEEELEGILWFW